MAAKSKRNSKKNPTAKGVEPRPLPLAGFAIGIALLVACVVASVMLVTEHFGANLPGCGPESDCAKVARSYWGSVPFLNWPTSFLGLAYFLGLFAAWLTARGNINTALRWLARLGALASIGFLLIMIDQGHICQYCVAVHVANLAFVVLLEFARAAGAKKHMALIAPACVFIAASVALGLADAVHRAAIDRGQEEALQDTIGEMIGEDNNGAVSLPVDDEPEAGEPFTGRWRRGPEVAAIRIVALTDFACLDCRKIEKQIETILARRDDVSLSIKHFPMSNVCNPHVPNDMHPKACYAARATEAAGILGGNDGFWAMHDWLFKGDNIRSFDAQSLPRLVRSMGYDWAEFNRIMNGEEVKDRILADIEEGQALGLHYTPMIFINGRELSVARGLFAANAVIRAVDAVAAMNPPARSAAYDHPPFAAEKYVEDWRDQPARTIPPASRNWLRVDEGSALKIVVWGDYQESGTIELDQGIRAAIADRDDASYVFRHYPMNQECNPVAGRSLHPLACEAAEAAEAAGILGGQKAWRQMHEWLIDHADSLNERELALAADAMDLDPDALRAAMESQQAADGIAEDCRVGKSLGLRSIPMLFVNGRQVPRWRLEGHNIVERILREATGWDESGN